MLNLDLQVLVVKNTHLEKDQILKKVNHKIIQSKDELIEYIDNNEFDILLSNGCPFILPISKLKKRIYANIHPSHLPDLKGIDPCLGSILYSRDGGATCHIMDDTIDGGPIISRVKIPFSKDLDVSLMYQLSFLAEKKVFHESFKENFVAKINHEEGDWIYYSRKSNDKIINFNEDPEKIIQRIKTFSNKSQGCFFKYKNFEFKVYDAMFINNEFVNDYSKNFKDLEIIFNYEDSIIFKKNGRVIKFTKVLGPINELVKGSLINN
ncbi:formyltransferase family protein [Candidatus Pelagibacter sp. HIMB1506]|uniref:formyltransferase family protein n=1 Tax=Candidatus Pelagibacter sp. HIMB1506 TaxID=3413337 RepID=UPI003F85FD7B